MWNPFKKKSKTETLETKIPPRKKSKNTIPKSKKDELDKKFKSLLDVDFLIEMQRKLEEIEDKIDKNCKNYIFKFPKDIYPRINQIIGGDEITYNELKQILADITKTSLMQRLREFDKKKASSIFSLVSRIVAAITAIFGVTLFFSVLKMFIDMFSKMGIFNLGISNIKPFKPYKEKALAWCSKEQAKAVDWIYEKLNLKPSSSLNNKISEMIPEEAEIVYNPKIEIVRTIYTKAYLFGNYIFYDTGEPVSATGKMLLVFASKLVDFKKIQGSYTQTYDEILSLYAENYHNGLLHKAILNKDSDIIDIDDLGKQQIINITNRIPIPEFKDSLRDTILSNLDNMAKDLNYYLNNDAFCCTIIGLYTLFGLNTKQFNTTNLEEVGDRMERFRKYLFLLRQIIYFAHISKVDIEFPSLSIIPTNILSILYKTILNTLNYTIAQAKKLFFTNIFNFKSIHPSITYNNISYKSTFDCNPLKFIEEDLKNMLGDILEDVIELSILKTKEYYKLLYERMDSKMDKTINIVLDVSKKFAEDKNIVIYHGEYDSRYGSIPEKYGTNFETFNINSNKVDEIISLTEQYIKNIYQTDLRNVKIKRGKILLLYYNFDLNKNDMQEVVSYFSTNNVIVKFLVGEELHSYLDKITNKDTSKFIELLHILDIIDILLANTDVTLARIEKCISMMEPQIYNEEMPEVSNIADNEILLSNEQKIIFDISAILNLAKKYGYMQSATEADIKKCLSKFKDSL